MLIKTNKDVMSSLKFKIRYGIKIKIGGGTTWRRKKIFTHWWS